MQRMSYANACTARPMYDEDAWKRHADLDIENGEFCKFITGLASSLHAESALEVGCSSGRDLKLFDPRAPVAGTDLSEYAISKARSSFPHWEFKVAPATDLPFEDNSFDFVFTHKTLNCLEDDQADAAVSEIFRVAKKYAANCEIYGGKAGSGGLAPMDALSRWMNYKVKVISNVDMHEEIEPDRARFTLVRKL